MKEPTHIYPTHRCFDDAFEIIQDLIKYGVDPEALKLVHALCRPDNVIVRIGEDKPGTIAHAWVEYSCDDSTVLCVFRGVLDGVTLTLTTDSEDYHDSIKPYNITSYSIDEAIKMNLEYENLGPWVKEYCAWTLKILEGV